jgi:hypothetical protein
MLSSVSAPYCASTVKRPRRAAHRGVAKEIVDCQHGIGRHVYAEVHHLRHLAHFRAQRRAERADLHAVRGGVGIEADALGDLGGDVAILRAHHDLRGHLHHALGPRGHADLAKFM